MSNKSPIKIYLTAETYQALTDGSKFVGAYAEKLHDKEVGFILESEHERQTKELQSEIERLKAEIQRLQIQHNLFRNANREDQ